MVAVVMEGCNIKHLLSAIKLLAREKHLFEVALGMATRINVQLYYATSPIAFILLCTVAICPKF